jgi:uncharacterized Zn finger protein (UPF0148 family)
MTTTSDGGSSRDGHEGARSRAEGEEVVRVRCSCCGHATLTERDGFEICPVCGWEDDRVQAGDPTLAGGANRVSLHEARASYARIGRADPTRARPDDVRAPSPDEVRDDER